LKSQVSIEYLMVMGFVVVITIPLLLIYFTYTSDSKDEIISSQVLQIATKIVDASEKVYSLGEPSQTTIKVYIPAQIVNASLKDREVLFNVSSRAGISQIVQVSSVELTGELPVTQGLHTITLKAKAGNVDISYK